MLAAHGLAAAIHLEEGSGMSRRKRLHPLAASPKSASSSRPYADLLRGHDGGMNKELAAWRGSRMSCAGYA